MVSKMPWPDFSGLDTPMEQLVKLSHYYGSDVDFVIAGGGNTSVKAEDRLFVKASGTYLANIEAGGFVEMDRRALDALLTADLGTDPDVREQRFKESILAARVHPERGQRPSVECVLHNILSRRFVVHTHSTVANWLACSRDGRQTAQELYGEDILWIPYVDPGFVLARSIHRALKDYSARTGRDCPLALLMQNHGLIVCADTPGEIREITDRIVEAIRARVGPIPSGEAFGPAERLDPEDARRLVTTIGPLLRGLLAEGNTLKIVRFDDSETISGYVGTGAGRAVAASGPLTPDQIVYCYSYPMWFEPKEGEDTRDLANRLSGAVSQHVKATGFPPLVVLARGLGMFAAGSSYAAAETVRLSYTDAIRVAAGAGRLGGASALAKRDREFIEFWEVEAYRRKIAAGHAGSGRMQDRVAVVTGAAQGFGKEIAEALAAAGAHVVLADLNLELAGSVTDGLAAAYGPGRACAIGVDVTEGRSVADAFYATVRLYGGLDLLVSNAGVLRAGSVKTQPLGEFDLVTSVNYKGYFVCVQNAAPIMALQRRARPGYWSDVIQINSKSGLVGSNRNSAYAGSKFGSVGLTQSFALELIEDGIKVNAVCPGNYFEGPLWSDPETGLFVQYLRTGKVPGAKTIADVRRAYEAKVPMGRGCTTADIMKAIFYLVEQKYETGQALPVTGGQVMLN
jgi:rhamnose utilization protein RhaD (predicted bifunctional aldolase and dehydrogenase)/NAD(P)-dependent dehydrogenase (short-subunit alcohol dehydrogenase family)